MRPRRAGRPTWLSVAACMLALALALLAGCALVFGAMLLAQD